MPPPMPPNVPVAAPMVPTGVLLLVQTPPPTVLVNVVVSPWQITKVPPIADGAGLTVTMVVT